MKVYLDELPKSCRDCQFCDKDNGLCEMLGQYFRDGYDYTDCPLQSLSDYTKQVRKEVLNKVYEVLEQAVPHDLCWSWTVIKKELDQIQGEIK